MLCYQMHDTYMLSVNDWLSGLTKISTGERRPAGPS